MIAKNEKEHLNKSFKTYELFYYTIVTVVYICTFILIVPFVKVYTLGITDANYIRPIFAYLFVLSELVWSIRLPYSNITLAAGHFKQTRKGAWIEAITNISISLVLVWKFGINGVAIGALVAMIIRTAEFMYHASIYILDRSVNTCIKRIILMIIEMGITIVLISFLPIIEFVSYANWIIYAALVGVLSTLVTVAINFIVYREDVKGLLDIIKRLFNRKKVNV